MKHGSLLVLVLLCLLLWVYFFLFANTEGHECGFEKLSTINVKRSYERGDEATLPLMTRLYLIEPINAETSNWDLLTRAKILT